MIKITIPLAPISKKNSQQIFINRRTGKPFIMPSAAYKDYEREAELYLPRGVHVETPVNIRCLFYMPTRRKCDLTNLLEAIDDVLVKAGILADDDFTVVESHDGSRVLYDKDNPRTEIYITASETLQEQAHAFFEEHGLTLTDTTPQGLHKYEIRGGYQPKAKTKMPKPPKTGSKVTRG